MSDYRAIADGLFPGGMDPAKLTELGRVEVRAAIEALLRIYERDNARLALALEQLDKGAAEIERLRAELATFVYHGGDEVCQAVMAERERCAKLVEDECYDHDDAQRLAAAIRNGDGHRFNQGE